MIPAEVRKALPPFESNSEGFLMISDAERNYEPRNWIKVQHLPDDREGLNQIEMYYICTSSSQRWKDLLVQQKGERALLLDYELLALDHDILTGTLVQKSPTRGLCLTVFLPGWEIAYYVEKPLV